MDAKAQRWSLLGSRWECECGVTHAVPVREVLLEPGAIRRLPELMQRQGLAGPAWLLADETTWSVAGERLATILGDAGIRVMEHVLPGRPRAEHRLAEAVASQVPADAATVITCGSGTITDLGKWAAMRHDLPQVAVATAPSMNGYASGIAALTKDGLKATTPVPPAVAVVADLEILAAAPLEMFRSGLGDILSKPVCNADWRLSSLIRGEHFCPRPFELIRDLEEVYAGRAHLLAQRDPAAIAALTEALIFAGVSMVIAGSSSPASGGEHLIAHVLDMRAAIEGREPGMHGTQVGVATIASAALYERLLNLHAADIDAHALATAWERGDAALERCCALLPHAAAAIREAYGKKRGTRTSFIAEAYQIAERWDELLAAARPFLKRAQELRAILEAAGAASTPRDLGVPAGTFRSAQTLAHCIRSRFTVLDVAFAVGRLED